MSAAAMAYIESYQPLDDEAFALQLQLEEIEAQRDLQTGKWAEDSPPDHIVAFDDFHAELKKAISLFEDLRFAHSIAKAVDSDAVAIDEVLVEEIQTIQDRDFALSLNEDGNVFPQNEINVPEMSQFGGDSIDWDHVLRATEASTQSIESYSTQAGPSIQYAVRQKTVLEHLPKLKLKCSVCGDFVHPHLTIQLACDDIYCKPCLKSFFLRVAKDETLFPPRCHRQPIDISVIEADFSSEALKVYRSAELEFTSTDRVYCAESKCAVFISPPQRTPDIASCKTCGTTTCMHCKARAHEGGCPADEARQNLLDMAEEQGWKSCFGCGEIVFRWEGCDHMTCRCKAEFCYRCGVKWKKCQCSDWQPELLQQRAEQVIDREHPGLAPAVRQRRVRDMEWELEENHECDHQGKFTMFEINSRRGRVCEMCGTRHWKFLLSCKRCHMLACQDCRCHRL